MVIKFFEAQVEELRTPENEEKCKTIQLYAEFNKLEQDFALLKTENEN